MASWDLDRGRSSLASSVAREMNVERGMCIPRVSWIRFWVSRTALRDIETAISVSGLSSSPGRVGDGVSGLKGGGEGICFGGATLILLRSRWLRFAIRADWSEE